MFSKVLDSSQQLLELNVSICTWLSDSLPAPPDSSLTFPQAIRDWLHSISSQHNPAEVRRGYLNQTKHKLKQARRMGASPPRGLVTELDPDGVLRAAKDGSDARLDVDDAVSRAQSSCRRTTMTAE